MPEVPGRLRPPRIASAPATPANGEVYYDTVSNRLFFWNGTMWVGGAGGDSELGYDQITTTVSILATTLPPTTVIAGSAHTFDGGPVVAEFFSPAVQMPSVAGGSVTALLMEAGVNIGIMGLFQNPAAAVARVPGLLRYRFTPSAGSHTYGFSAYCSATTGGPFIGAGAGGLSINTPAYLRFTKV